MSEAALKSVPIQLIKAKGGLLRIDFGELWQYRELFWFMAWRDILVRYKQSVLGVMWAVLRPVLYMIVFTVIFGQLAGMQDSTEYPYALVTFTAILPWTFFSSSVSSGSLSMISSSHIISKIYFPRLIVPISSVVSNMVDFAISIVILFAMMAYYLIRHQITLHPQILLLPVFFVVCTVAAVGLGLWLSALAVKFRDVKHVVPFVVQMGMYVSPVGYLTSKIGPKWQFWYSLNPMVGVIDGFRWCLLGGSEFQPNWLAFGISTVLVAIMTITGVYFFRSSERTFADII